MADLSFYKNKYNITTQENAFDKFISTVQSYYDATYYVNWEKVFESTKKFEREFALLSTLCNKPNKKQAAQELIAAYPQLIPALPILIACRESVTLVSNAKKAQINEYSFSPIAQKEISAASERYAEFIASSGIVELLEHIKSVPDYVTGVEVGMDTNARKNRGGNCGVAAITPWITSAKTNIPQLEIRPEASYEYLISEGFSLPNSCRGLHWDYSFWIGKNRKRLVVMEVNHYGSSGSKPSAIAREYAAREESLKKAGIGFIWVTDGAAWKNMKNPLREAFMAIDYIVNIKLASEGQLTAALSALLT